MNIRSLNPSDVDAYRRLRLWSLQESPTAFGSSYAEELHMPMERVRRGMGLDNPDESFVLGAFTDQGRLVGMIGCYREHHTKSRHKSNIWGMFVAPDFRRQGIGRALLDKAVLRAKTMAGVGQLNLSVVTTNEAARGLYRSCGFEPFGLERDAYLVGGDFCDAEYMTLRLEGDEVTLAD